MAAQLAEQDRIIAPMRGVGFLMIAIMATGVAWVAVISRHSAQASPRDTVVSGSLLSSFQQTTLIAGTATYYADDFQGRLMASGRPFDLNDPSIAASNQWPLGTRLRLQRAAGGPYDATLSPAERERYFYHPVIVTVQDHGDFTHALDLSRAAFAQLGRPQEGVISILIESLGNGDGAKQVTLDSH